MAQQHYGLQENTSYSNKKAFLYVYLAFLGVNSLFAMSVATQSIAIAYNYQEGLGSYLFIALNKAWYAPYNVFIWAALPSISQEIVDKAIDIAQLCFITPQIIFLAIILFSWPKGNKKLHGSAHFAKEQDINDIGYLRGAGVYVGGFSINRKQILYLRHNGPEHILCFAPTRSGKGVGLILPTLLSWEGSSIVLDIKGENWALTAGFRKSQGQTVLRFDPADASGSACKFNPLEEIRLDTLYAIQDVQNTAMMIVDPEGKGLSDHWTKAAFAFFSGIILYALVTIKANQERSATLLDLTIMMSDKSRTIEELLSDMMEDHCELVAKFAPHAAQRVGEAITVFINSSAAEMSSKAENEASGVISSALINMALYRDPIININTESSDFHIKDLMNAENPVNLYLVLSPDNIDRVRPLIRLITDLIIRRICKSMAFKDGASVAGYKHRLLLMLDEFTSLGKLPIIEKGIAYLAGYGGKLYLIVQDISQLNGVYGKDNALMANCHVRIAYAPNTPETAKILSEMTGKTTVVEKKISISSSKGGSSKSTSISETARPLLTPDECMRLPSAIKNAKGLVLEPGHMLIFTAGQAPIYGCQILYFKDPIFSKRAKIEAPGISAAFPAGITDSLYYPRSKEWYAGNIISENSNKIVEYAQNELEIGEGSNKVEKSFNDSPNLSQEAEQEIRAYCDGQGWELSEKPRHWKSKSGSQEAHEAIRPTHIELDEAGTNDDEKALYQLIRLRTLASQLADAIYAVRIVKLEALLEDKAITFEAKGSTLIKQGWKVLVNQDQALSDEDDADKPDNPIPALKVDSLVTALSGEVLTKKTKPLARFTLAALVRELEKRGIGRPATYASILDNILKRQYIKEDKRKLFSTELGEKLISTMTGHFDFLDYDFTKNMEQKLDDIAENKADYKGLVGETYNHLIQEIDKFKKSNAIPCPECNSLNLKHVFRAKSKVHDGFDFFSCPDCNNTFPTVDGQPGEKRTAPELTDFSCAKCQAKLKHIKGQKGSASYDFFVCSNEKCKATFDNVDGTPTAREAPKKSKYKCKKCKKPLFERPTKNGGVWFACSDSKCKERYWANDDGTPKF